MDTYACVPLYIYAYKDFTSESQISFSLKGKMATCNYFASLSFSAKSSRKRTSLSAGPQMALGGTGNKGCEGEEAPSMLGSWCKLAACSQVAAGRAAQHFRKT